MFPRLTTAVVGAGPAGLLFAIVGRMLAREEDAWAIRLFDKRETYGRTHRLRLDPKPYLEIDHTLGDARFSAFTEFLRSHEYAPEVNVLEEHLIAMATAVGVKKELVAVGPGEGETTLEKLRARLDGESLIGPETKLTIVAADGVRSAVREMVRGDVTATRHTHERIARIRVVGDDLPKKLAAVDQVRLSKVLGSVIDYRLNRNGFAEMDLFLTKHEHDIVRALGATPRDPVLLTASLLGKLSAPLFRAIVDHLLIARTPRQIFVQSTFELEHAVMPKLVFRAPAIDADVFLLGDAGISLPFQRGMACLGRCALSLARVHCDLLRGEGASAQLGERYDVEAHAIEERELTVVRSRAQIVGLLREIVRVSALLPFPIQSWWLRAEDREAPDREDRDARSDPFSLWFFMNVGASITAFAIAIGGSLVHSPLMWVSLAVEMGGGVAYHSALAFENGSHRHVRRIWEIQIAALFFIGIGCFIAKRADIIATTWWLSLAIAFVIGLYVFERLVMKWFARADLA